MLEKLFDDSKMWCKLVSQTLDIGLWVPCLCQSY